jgi:Lipocalin-like domain
MTILPFTCIITLHVFVFSSCANVSQNSMSKFTGMWKLDKYESFDSTSGQWHDSPNRMGYTGYILYDGIGHMGVQLLPPGFKDVDKTNIDSASNDELRKTLQLQVGSFSYLGNCNMTDSGIIEHHRLSSNHPKEWGTTIKRSFEFKGDTLILTANELIGGLKTRLRWIKI